MSGFELVGVVLAVIPLIISAAEHYKEGKSLTFRVFHKEQVISRYQDELKQQVSLLLLYMQTVLGETDLPAATQKRLLVDAISDSWAQPDVRIALDKRLGPEGMELFSRNLGRITDALCSVLEDTKSLHLNLPEKIRRLKQLIVQGKAVQGKSNPEKSSLWIQLSFSWKDPDKNRNILEVRECNAKLSEIIRAVEGSKTFVKKQEVRNVHGSYHVHSTSRTLSTTLTNCCSCNNGQRPEAKLRMKPMFRDSTGALKFSYDVVLCRAQQPTIEADIRVDLDEDEALPTTGVRFISNPHNENTLPKSGAQAEYLEDICSSMDTAQTQRSCMHLVIDEKLKLRREISLRKSKLSNTCQFVSLRDSLERLSTCARRTWLRREKAILSVILAYSILQLHDSPWLRAGWSMKDIMFIESQNLSAATCASAGCRFDKPFVGLDAKAQSPSVQSLPEQDSTMRKVHRNPILLALGVTLLELYLNRPLLDTGDNDTLQGNEFLSRAMEMLQESYDDDMPEEQYNAIRFCLFPRPDRTTKLYSFDDAGFREIYYQRVILPLENYLQMEHAIDETFWQAL